MPLDDSPVMTEAKARIVWGESPSSVRAYMIANGISEGEADAKIQELYAERNAEMRGLAVKSIIISTVLVAAVYPLWYMAIHGCDAGYATTRGAGSAIGAAIFASIYGLWKITNGIYDLFRPQSEKGSMSELDEQ